MAYVVPSPESRAHDRNVAIIKALARAENRRVIQQIVETPGRGEFRGSAGPLDEQTRTITFVVNARAYDDCFDLPGR